MTQSGMTQSGMTQSGPTVWCPSCGTEYRAGTQRCAECGVALVPEPPGDELGDDDATSDLVEMGEWPRLAALLLRRRLESAGVPVMLELSGTGPDAAATLVVPDEHGDFAWSVINEVAPAEEMPDSSPDAYAAAIEEHLAAASALLDELRARLELPDDVDALADD